MTVTARVAEILRAADEILRRFDRWLLDPHGGPVIPDDVSLGIQWGRSICDSGAIPGCCRDLAIVAIPRLTEELFCYQRREPGKVRLENGAPGPSFWASAKAVARARSSAITVAAPRLETVAVLLEQGVTCDQIARHIYGRRGIGPFLQPNGNTDVGLVEQEARQPGSVIPDDWVPPWHQALLARRQRVLTETLTAFDRQEFARTYDDPTTVELLLRQGTFVQQIERSKGVTRDDILETARRIGVAPIDGPGYQSARDLLPTEIDDEEEVTASVADRRALKALVVEMHTQSDGTRSATDIAMELRRLGHEITTNAVAATISHWKRKLTRPSASAT